MTAKKKTKIAKRDALSPVDQAERANRKVIALALVQPVETVQKSGGAGDSRAIENPWNYTESTYGTLMPPLDPVGLALLEETSSELGQCYSAYEINIPGFGWRIKPTKDVVEAMKDDELFTAKVLAEKERFEELLTYIDYDDESFVKLRRNSRREYEQGGNCYWEVIRDSRGDVCSLRLMPHTTVRLRPKGEPVKVDRRRPTGKGKERKFKTVSLNRRFRTFVQARFAGRQAVTVTYFKEYGDPRVCDSRTGEFATAGEENAVPNEHRATEIIHKRIYNSRSKYGMPRYTGNLLSVFGSRKSEEINFTTFTNNNIPSMALLVSNGEVTDETVARIKAFTETQIQGQDNYSKMLIIEALAEEDSGDNVRIKLEPLVREQHTDELFQIYDKNNRIKVRSSFRLPPIFSGHSADYNRATAEVSRALADEQVFHPERLEDDHQINRILRDEGMLYNVFVTNTPNVTNDQNLIAVMGGAEKSGGMTPRIARSILEDVLNVELPEFTGEFDPDVPFSLSMAEAVKNMGKPNEVGQQVTALKAEEVDASWFDRVQSALTLRLSESDEEAGVNIALNAGSQAEDISDGLQRAYISPIALSLNGREMYVSDGQVIFAKCRFGEVQKLSIEKAALFSGLEVDDVQGLFPGKVEVYVAEIEARDKIDPVAYEHPADSLFTVVVNG